MTSIKTPGQQLLAYASSTTATPRRPNKRFPSVPQRFPGCVVKTDSRTQIEQTLGAVQCAALRQFLSAVVAEHEVKLVLTHVPRLIPQQNQTPVLVQLRRAAQITCFWSVHTAERETLYVATFIRGVQELLGSQVVGSTCTASELTFAIVRVALHRLDDQAPAQSRLLRLALGWGNEDEVDAVYVPRIQHTVLQALRSVGLLSSAI